MCRYWALRFPCGCSSSHSSGYEFCDKRGSCKISLKQYTWLTFCPQSRKTLKGRKYTPGIRLPACCDKLDSDQRKRLCRKCNSEPTNPSARPTLWHCPAHLQLTEEDHDAQLNEAEEYFEKAVAMWDLGHQRRYLRRKVDKTVKGVWWSY